jgi:hypothetical protein
MAVLLELNVVPFGSEVALVDRTWQDYPRWEDGQKWVAFRAPSLVHPDKPPYSGFVVATRSGGERDWQQRPGKQRRGKPTVRVEVRLGLGPPELNCVHESVLAVSSHGVWVGNQDGGGSQNLELNDGNYPIRILVDAGTPDQVSRVVFALPRSGFKKQ